MTTDELAECSIIYDEGRYTAGYFDITESVNLIIKEKDKEIERLNKQITDSQKMNEESGGIDYYKLAELLAKKNDKIAQLEKDCKSSKEIIELNLGQINQQRDTIKKLEEEKKEANGKVEDYMKRLFDCSVEKDKLKEESQELKNFFNEVRKRNLQFKDDNLFRLSIMNILNELLCKLESLRKSDGKLQKCNGGHKAFNPSDRKNDIKQYESDKY